MEIKGLYYFVEQRIDTEFGRNRESLVPLDRGPYYAAELVPSALYTIGGLIGSPTGETLGWDNKPIPRLFHAGDIGQPMELVISGLAGVMALGSIAGKNAAQLPSRK
jgi:hypothetical protein